jgi:hypothetical protein
MRKKIVAGNWKMNKTYEEALSLTSEIDNMVKDEVSGDVTVIVTPPFPYLQPVGKLVPAARSRSTATARRPVISSAPTTRRARQRPPPGSAGRCSRSPAVSPAT